MKGFVIFAFCVICFVSNSAGLKCYRCTDVRPEYPDCTSDLEVEVCDQWSTFCLTASNTNDERVFNKCSEEQENCLQKSCMSSELCKEPGTYVLDSYYQNITITCCIGDLYNAFSSASVCKTNLSCYNLLFTFFLLSS